MISIETTEAASPAGSDGGRAALSRSSIHFTQSVGPHPGSIVSSPVSS